MRGSTASAATVGVVAGAAATRRGHHSQGTRARFHARQTAVTPPPPGPLAPSAGGPAGVVTPPPAIPAAQPPAAWPSAEFVQRRRLQASAPPEGVPVTLRHFEERLDALDAALQVHRPFARGPATEATPEDPLVTPGAVYSMLQEIQQMQRELGHLSNIVAIASLGQCANPPLRRGLHAAGATVSQTLAEPSFVGREGRARGVCVPRRPESTAHVTAGRTLGPGLEGHVAGHCGWREGGCDFLAISVARAISD